ncbi:MAG: hypothetical protein ACREFX_11250, partial [Opitutaceae bacterium]
LQPGKRAGRAAAGLRVSGAIRQIDDEPAFLKPLPIAAAEPSDRLAEILALWGLRTLGAVRAIPKAEFGGRLGAEGIDFWERASGEATRLIVPARLPDAFEAAWEFSEPIETLEPLLFIVRRLIGRLTLELRAAGFAAAALRLSLALEDEGGYERELPMPEPSGDADRLFRVLHTHLETVRTAAAVKGLRLVAFPARPLVKQPGLFETGLKDPQGFSETLARLAALVGPENVGTPEPARTYRPDSCRLAAPEATIPPPPDPPAHPPQGLFLRRFRPPVHARVELREGRPCSIEGAGPEKWRLGRASFSRPDRFPIAACRGPWRESGEWWAETRWARELWQIELAAGGLYQLARTGSDWAIEGMLD